MKDFEEVNTHFDTNKPKPSRKLIYEGHLIYDKLRFDKENEKLVVNLCKYNGLETKRNSDE